MWVLSTELASCSLLVPKILWWIPDFWKISCSSLVFNMLKLAATSDLHQLFKKTNGPTVKMHTDECLYFLFTIYLMTLPVASTVQHQMVELQVNNELERLWKEQSWNNLRYYPGICLGGFRKTT